MTFPPMVSPRFRTNPTTGDLEYKPFPSYPTWLVAWESPGGGSPPPAGERTLIVTFDHNVIFPLTILPAQLDWVAEIRLEFFTTWDGTFTVGDDSNNEKLMTTLDNLPSLIASYETHPSLWLDIDAVKLYFTGTVDLTYGNLGVIYVRYKESV